MNPSNHGSTDSIQAQISSIVDKLRKDACWTAPFPFPCQVRFFKGHVLCANSYYEQDLNGFIASTMYDRHCQVYFDPKSYPPPIGRANKKLLGSNHDTFAQLRTDLQRTAFLNGQPIISNGSSKGDGSNSIFTCHCRRTYKEIQVEIEVEDDEENVVEHDEENEVEDDKAIEDGQDEAAEDGQGKKKRKYRRGAMHNDRAKHARGAAGQKLARRTVTVLPTEVDHICHYRFTIRWDDIGYYLCLGSGRSVHEHHPKLRPSDFPYPTRFIEPHEMEVMNSIARANVNNGAGCMVFYERNGHHITRSKVRNVTRRSGTQPGLSSVGKVTAMESLITTLKESDGHQWAVLYDEILDIEEGEVDELLIQESNAEFSLADIDPLPSGLETTLETIPEFPDVLDPDDVYVYAGKDTREHLRVEMRRHAVEKRAALRGLLPSQKMVVAVAWGLNSAIRLFKLFPEVIHCDVTVDTNREKRPLLTFSTRESTGRQVIFLYVLLPDEKACSFRWVFQAVLPTLLRRENLNRVNVIIRCCDRKISIALTLSLPMETLKRQLKWTTCETNFEVRWKTS